MLIEVNGLTKSFDKQLAVNNVSFEVNAAEVLGIVGPNGAGKTTLLNILAKNIFATSGNVFYREKLTMNLCCGQAAFFPDMTVIDNIEMYERLLTADTSNLNDLLNYFQITYTKKLFHSLSSGMKQRVALCLAFLGNTDLIFLDEPTNHLDLEGVILLREMIALRVRQGTTVVVTSHVLTDMEKTCDRIIFLKKGEATLTADVKELVVEHGTLEEAYITMVQKS
jgi:ABC-type multidrug transport system ATPase subunit